LPNDMSRQDLCEALRQGLSEYGTVIKFEMEQSLLMPHLSAPRAIAILKPKQHVRPEQAPPVCAHCSFIGHCANACPKTVEGLQRLIEGTEDDECAMEDDYLAKNALLPNELLLKKLKLFASKKKSKLLLL
ncbi:4fe-4s ferredoxin, partial [Lasius niger]